MNDYDRENLNFLLSCSPEELKAWYDEVSEDDHEYASELMVQYSEELKLRDRFNVVESINIDGLTPDAEEYLKKFSIKK